MMRVAIGLCGFLCASAQPIRNTPDISPSPIEACPSLTPRDAPSDVKDLRPVDIKVLGAMGDSFTAGFAIDNLPYEVRNEVYVTGDRANATTLANFFKHYGDKLAIHNVAVSGDVVQGMDKQAKRLVAAIKGDKSVDLQHDWKLITILIGGNNQCASCFGAEANQPSQYTTDLTSAIDILQQGLPRTLVNLIAMVNLSSLATAPGVDGKCAVQHVIGKAECPCPFRGSADVAKMTNVIEQDNANLFKIAQGFGTQEFGVVVQPGLGMMSVPDWTYLSRFDCFHPSLLTHQQCALGLWSNLFEPVASKTKQFHPPLKVYCPTDDDVIHSASHNGFFVL